jgi:hypothetical protein
MTVSIVQSSIRIFIMPDAISSEVKIQPLGLVPHTKFVPNGFASFLLSNSSPALRTGIQFGGHAEFSLGPGDTLAGWKVGFIQIVRDRGGTTRYSGRTPTEGSIVCDPRPGLSRKALLDCLNQSTIPWVDTRPNELFTGSASSVKVAALNTRDSPKVNVPLAMMNQASNVYNFLYDFRREAEFRTILTAMEPTGALQHLGYCHWRIVHKVDFVWRSAAPQPFNWGSFTRLDQDKGEFVPGAPPTPICSQFWQIRRDPSPTMY